MAGIFRSIYKATRHIYHVEETCLCPKIRELWIQIIEGNDATDDVWLWMDGDEQWLREHLKDSNLGKTAEYHKRDWVDSQSALPCRRRIRKPRNHVEARSLQNGSAVLLQRNALPSFAGLLST